MIELTIKTKGGDSFQAVCAKPPYEGEKIVVMKGPHRGRHTIRTVEKMSDKAYTVEV